MRKLKTRLKQEVRKYPKVWSLLHKLRGVVRDSPIRVVHESFRQVAARRHQRAGNLLVSKGDLTAVLGWYRQAISHRPELFIALSSHLAVAPNQQGAADLQPDKLAGKLIPTSAAVYFKIGKALRCLSRAGSRRN